MVERLELDEPRLTETQELTRRVTLQGASLHQLLAEWDDLLEWAMRFPHCWVFREELIRKIQSIHPV